MSAARACDPAGGILGIGIDRPDRRVEQSVTLPVAVRSHTSIGADMMTSTRLVAFCPHQQQSQDIDECLRCPFGRGERAPDMVLCEVEELGRGRATPLSTPIGAVLHGNTVFVSDELPLDALRRVELEQTLVPVVADGAYVGCVEPALVLRLGALVSDPAGQPVRRVRDLMVEIPPVSERAALVDAAAAMARAHARHLPVLKADGELAGVIRDVDLLGVIARTRGHARVTVDRRSSLRPTPRRAARSP